LSSLNGGQSTVSANRQTDAHKLKHLLRGELDWITMKALEKDRRRRYDTPSAFAADIQRYRKHQPVEAGPPSAWYRGRKFVRRNRLVFSITAIVTISAAVVVGMWTWSVGRLNRANRDAEQARTEARRRTIEARYHRYAVDIRQVHQFVIGGAGTKALELLRKYRPVAGQEDMRSFAWHYLMRLCHEEGRSFCGGERGRRDRVRSRPGPSRLGGDDGSRDVGSGSRWH
jgi:eukaryotic-like serine/threonine-protein kinase